MSVRWSRVENLINLEGYSFLAVEKTRRPFDCLNATQQKWLKSGGLSFPTAPIQRNERKETERNE